MIYSLFAIIALVCIDQISKYLIVTNLSVLGTSAPFIPGIVQFKYTHNYGASFSILQGKQIFLIVLTGIALAVMLYLLFANKFKTNWEKAAFVLIIGGGIGNLIDRVINGYVVDFFDLQFMQFAIFNVADCFVCIGVFLYIIYIICSEIKNQKNKKTAKNLAEDTKE